MTDSETAPAAHASRPRSRGPWIVALVVVVLLLAVGAGLAVTRGLGRTDLYDHALTALAAGDRTSAESLLRELLDINPAHPTAREKLLDILLEDERFDEARAIAKEWTEQPERPELGWAYLIEVELRQAHLGEAERIAREVMDRLPELSLITIVRVRDALGTYRDRWEAQKAATHVATITATPARKAQMLLFAAETILDLSHTMAEGAREPAGQIARRCLEEALRTLNEATPVGTESDEARQLRARILLLSKDEFERESGERTLKMSLATQPDDVQAQAAMAAFYAAQEDWPNAVAKVRDLEGPTRPYLVWLRAVRRLAARAPIDVVLPLLDASARPDEPLFVLLRAEVLLRGDEDQRQQAADLLLSFAEREEIDRRILVAAYRLLAASGERTVALGILERIPDHDLDAAERALLGTGLGASGESGRSAAMLDGLAGRVRTIREAMVVLGVLQQGNDQTVRDYLSSPITVEGDEGARLRLMRAASAATFAFRSEPSDRRDLLMEAARSDLAAIPPGTAKGTLSDAFRLSLVLQDYEQAGRLLGHAIEQLGRPNDLALFALSLARGTEEDFARAAVATGLRSVAADSPAARYLSTVADAVETPGTGDWQRLREALSRVADDPVSKSQALVLGIQLANSEGDLESSRALAEALVASDPGFEFGRALLGDQLIRNDDYEALLALHEDNTGADLDATRQRALALFELGREAEAIDLTRESIEQHGARSDEPHLLMAHLRSRNRQPVQALGALAAAPGTQRVLLRRAQLLNERGELWAAETLYVNLLARDPANRLAWFGLANVLAQQSRHQDIVDVLTRTFERPPPRFPDTLRGELLALRGSALETLADYTQALRDYDAAIELVPDSAVALNNAAWMIAEIASERLTDAKRYVEHALEMEPENASVLDTAARVYQLLNDAPTALEHIDHALHVTRKPGYMVRRASILLDLKRADDAKSQLIAILDEFPGTRQSARAAEMLRDIR